MAGVFLRMRQEKNIEMRKFKVTIGCRSYSTYIVEAENEDEATDLALSGGINHETHEEYDFEIDGIEELDVPTDQETTEITKNFVIGWEEY